jgi:hypothetical protein
MDYGKTSAGLRGEGEKIERERWRRDEARRLAIVAVRQFSSNFSQQSML